MGLRAHLPLGFAPSSLQAHGPWWGGAHYWPMHASGAGGPTWWTPGPLRWSRYTTGDARNTSGGQNHTSYISIFTSGPFQNSS